MFPYFPSVPNPIQNPACNGLAPQQMMLPNLQQQLCNPGSQPNPVGFNNTQQIPPQLRGHSHQFQNPNPQMGAFCNQNMENIHGRGMVMPNHPQLAPSPSVAYSPNVPPTAQTSLMGMQPQQGNPCLQHHPQNLNQIVGVPYPGQICNTPQNLNQLGVPQLGGQFGVNSQMHNMNQIGPSPQGEHIWPQNLLQNLSEVMGLQGQFGSQHTMLLLNQFQQFLQHAGGTTQAGPFYVPLSSLPVVSGPGSQNTFLSNSHLGPRNTDSGIDNVLLSTDRSKSKAQDMSTSSEMAIASHNAAQKSPAIMQSPISPFAAVSRRINDTHRSFPSDSVQPGQIGNVPQAVNQLGVPKFSGQFGVNDQMHNVNQIGPFPQRDHLRPQNPLQSPSEVMALQGQSYSQNTMLPLNQIQQLLQHAGVMTQAGPFNVPVSSFPAVSGPGSQNTFLSNSHLGSRDTFSGIDKALLSTDCTKSKAQSTSEMLNVSQNAAQQSLAPMQKPLPSPTAVSRGITDIQKILPFDSVRPPQVSHITNGKNDVSAAISGNYVCRSFQRNSHGTAKRHQSHRRFQTPNHHVANGGSISKNWGKGPQNGREQKHQPAKFENRDRDRHQRRRVPLKYTEEEIKQWREARKRNFPTAANIERKRCDRNGDHEAINEDAKICYQQLKEVLVKQMELGFEAAEVPSYLLSDPENKSSEKTGKYKPHMAHRFSNKDGKKRSKRQNPRDEASPVPVPRKREPTLLHKLLSSEIKRDHSQLLQVFRFMTLNSFFEHWPGKPLKYPQVFVKDLACNVDCANEKPLRMEGTATITSGFGNDFTAEEAVGQAGPGAVEEAEESTRAPVLRQEEEDSVYISREQTRIEPYASTEEGELSG